jgi:prepilin-type N-terminal cleavage/methylation domain-containing protein/prepilin-type processing-associated H-X9-DG protein
MPHPACSSRYRGLSLIELPAVRPARRAAFSLIELSAVRQRKPAGFSLIELIVVIGIIAVLIAILLPTMAKVRQQARCVQCQSNLRSIGQMLLMYANANDGWIYPVGQSERVAEAASNNYFRLGALLPPEQRWPNYVKGIDRWDNPILVCPHDDDPQDKISYAMNFCFPMQGLRFHNRAPGGASPSESVVMGEKRAEISVYFFADSEEYDGGADPWKHGLSRGSNYLFLDLHAATCRPKDVNWGFPTTP